MTDFAPSVVRAATILAALTTVACAQQPLPPAPAPAPAPAQVPPADTTPARDTVARAPVPTPKDTAAPRAPRSRRPTASRTKRADAIRVCGGGDVTLGNNLDPAWAARAERLLRSRWNRSAHPDSLISPLRSLVEDADIVLLNVEGAIGTGPARQKCGTGSTNCYAFRSPVEAAVALRSVAPHAAVVGNVANNHARDAGPAGYRATREHLEAAGVHVTGMDTLATPVATANGDTIAFLGFYTSTETPDARNLAEVRRHVARARERWPIVVVSTHMGAEGRGAQRTRDATEMFLGRIDRGNPVAFARAAFEAGASLVLGHGPHVMRAAEWRDGRLAFYSLGNLLTYGPFSNGEPSNRGAIACASILPEGIVAEASLRSTVQRAPGVLAADASHRAAAIVDSLARLDFPRTGVRVQRDGTIIVPHAVPGREAPRDSVAAPDSAAPRDTARRVRRDTVRPDTVPPARQDGIRQRKDP